MIHDMNKRYTKWNQFHTLFRYASLLLLLLVGSMGAKAADYVFMYNGGYLSLDNNGAVTYTTTFSRSCIWTCLNTSSNAAALSDNNNTNRFLYTYVGDTQYWLVGSNSSGTALTASTTQPDAARWKGATNLYWNQSGSYYVYLDGNTWKVSRNDYGNTRPTNNAVSSSNTAVMLSTPTITPASASLDYNGSATFTASATTTPAYTTYTFNGDTYYYYNNTMNNAAPSSTTSGITYSWTLSGAANSYLSPNSGTGSTITITHSTQAPDDANSTLSVTASANGQSATSTSNATVTAEAPKVDPTGITLSSGTSMTVSVGSTGTITYSLQPNPCYNNVTFTSSNTSIATVSNSGVVTGVAAGSATITVSAKKIDGSTSVDLTKTVTVSVRDKVATPTISFTPDANDNTKATATITCSTLGTTIYYTTNGSDPTVSSTAYSAPFTIDENIELRAIAVNTTDGAYWDNSDIATGTYISCITNAPTISYTQSSGIATVTIKAETGATIYYTTNGNDPTTSSSSGTTTVTINSVSSGTTIKAFAKNGTCQASSIVSQEIITSGVSGGTVTLYDYEDHNWTYYSGVDASIDQGNYNTNYRGKIYSPNPRNVKITYKANDGAVSIDESETEFVYYKTLEEGTTSGQYPYTVISNPFSKRPNGKGFGGWRIKEGADYINGYADEAILPLDADIVFTNLPYASVNCTSAEIELEATWVNLNNITYASGNNINYNVSGGTYETNILVLNRNVTGTITTSSPVTIMMVEPDGSRDYRGTYTFTGNITPNNNGVTKIEFTRWNSTNTVNAGYRNLWIGRGMTTTSRCANLITGYNATSSVASPQYSIKVESGVYQYFDFYKGHSTYNSGTNNTEFTVSGTAANAKITMGNDYDRAKGANATLEFIYGPMFGYSGNFSDRGNRDNKHTLDLTVKSGTIGSTFFMEDTNTATYLQGGAGQCMYLSSAGSQTNVGTRNVIIEGGDICSIGGGIDSYNNAPSNNNTPNTTTNYERLSFNLRIKGGTIHGNVYGGAAKSPGGGNRVMVMTGGQVKGWFAAGCNGTDDDGGQTYGTSYVYIGGNSSVNSEGSTKVLGYANGGNVYAAGAGRQGATSCGEMTFGTNLVIADDSYIERGIYGGGNYGYALDKTNIYITGGTNEGKDGTVNYITTQGGVYGGANQQDGPTINLYMTDGTMKGGVYGGCNTQGTISGDVTMKINGGQVGTSSQTANIHGGGYGSSTVVDGWVTLTLGQEGQTEGGVTVYGDVYGGSALGEVNGTAANSDYYTRVTLNKGVINGSLYGGGLGDGTYDANVNGPVIVTVNGGSVKTTAADGSGAVYGCNNISGAPQRSVTVIINGTDPAPDENTYALDAVYGGGNKANYNYGTPTVTVNNCDNSIAYVYGGGNAAHITNGGTDVTIYGGNKIGTVFGGGNGTVTPANVQGGTNVKIYGGTIGQVFGGSNSQGTIGGTINVTIQKQGSCAMHIDEVYGGGNMAASNAGNLTIGCTGNEGEGIGDVYGGANAADITGNIALNITGGSINRVFGGNNASGSISGTIQVDVNWNSTCGYNYLGSVFGGGNQAAYGNAGQNKGNYPIVNILNGTVSEDVFGGGLGATAIVYGNPQVTIGDATAEHKAIVKGDVYGGGDAAAVSGTPVVKVVNKCNTEIGNVYGGGNAADVTATNVTINGGTVKGDVYGGGHGDKSADVSANVNGNVSLSVTGGTINRVFGGSNSQGNISGTISVNIDKGNESCDMKIGEVYGGGNEAAGNAGSITIGCTGTPALSTIDATHRLGYELEGIGDVYGGANAADIGTSGAHSDITLNIQGGAINRVFGGNNTSGTIYGDIEVNIDWSGSCTNYLYDVFGCGNVADYSGSSTVNLINGDVSHCVYGGGNEADAGTAATYIKGGTVASGVYGGCNTSGTATGDITVGVTGGTIGTSSARANVHGGGYGSETASEGNVTVSIGTTSGGVNSGTGVIYGDVYGGSALGNVNSDTSDNTNVNLLSGTVHGDVYGGGLGDSENAALVKGNVVVKLNEGVTTTKGCIVDGRIFGCNNANGTPQGLVTVYVYATQKADKANVTEKADKGSGTFDVQAVYGGGNQAAYQPTNLETGKSKVVINGCGLTSIGYVYGGGNAASSPATEVEVNSAYEIDYVFGGGNGKDALPDGSENPGAHVGYLTWEEGSASNVAYGTGIATTNLYGGTINHVFGGSNTKGNVREVAVAMLDEGGDCDLKIEEIYGGGNEAYMEGKGSINLGCVTYMKEVYGGAKNAPVGNDVELTITSGHFDRVFGGNNIGGSINGSITVNIEETGCNPITIGELYGCGNAAAYTTPAGKSQPTINIKSCTSIGRVFGGGFGSTADVTGSPVVNINEVVGENSTTASTYAGTTRTLKDGTTVTLPPHTSGAIGAIGTVYGGGNAAQVTGNTTVHIGTQPTISYVSGNDHNAKTVVGANITGNVFGGGLGSSAVVTGNTDVVIGK